MIFPARTGKAHATMRFFAPFFGWFQRKRKRERRTHAWHLLCLYGTLQYSAVQYVQYVVRLVLQYCTTVWKARRVVSSSSWYSSSSPSHDESNGPPLHSTPHTTTTTTHYYYYCAAPHAHHEARYTQRQPQQNKGVIYTRIIIININTQLECS
jgi:hypothetical protein